MAPEVVNQRRDVEMDSQLERGFAQVLSPWVARSVVVGREERKREFQRSRREKSNADSSGEPEGR